MGGEEEGTLTGPGNRDHCSSFAVPCSTSRFLCCYLHVDYALSCKCMEFALYFMFLFFVRLT